MFFFSIYVGDVCLCGIVNEWCQPKVGWNGKVPLIKVYTTRNKLCITYTSPVATLEGQSCNEAAGISSAISHQSG